MKHLYLILCLISILALPFLQISRPVPPAEWGPREGLSNLRFIQNKGQWEPSVRFKAPLRGGDIWLESAQMVYSFYEVPEEIHSHGQTRHFGASLAKEELLHGHIVNVKWVGANPHSGIRTDFMQPHYQNYFLGDDPSRWASRVRLFGMVAYEDLYPGIDLRFYGVGESFKYDFIVAPGEDPSQITLEYEGADALYLEKGNLIVRTSVREMVEYAPVAYHQVEGKNVIVPCEYHLDGNRVTYTFPEGYDTSQTLIIDPTLDFSTFTGSTHDNWGFTATYDDSGNLYAGGILWTSPVGSSSYPTTPGAYQTSSRGGSFETTITKFNSTGTALEYSTLLGGTTDDRPHSLVVNSRQELYVYGRTNSNDFPHHSSGWDTTHNGGFDIFVVRFNPGGTQILGATFIGGSQDEAVNENSGFFAGTTLKYNYGDDARGEIILDQNGNCYIASCTNSSDFPSTPGVFQDSLGGQQDGCVIKLDSTLSTAYWSSFLGGSLMDAAYAMQVDENGVVYATGGTSSLDFPGVGGGYNAIYGGGRTDGFVAKIDSVGGQIIQATYVGTSAYDQTYLIQLDDDLDVYVAGQTESGSYPVINSPYVDAGAKQFITKFDNTLTGIIYSTTYGTPNAAFPNVSPTAFLVDKCEHVYVAGWGGNTNYLGNTNAMPVTSDALQSTTDGSDLHLFVLERDADSMLYGSYLGGNFPNGFSGEHVDGGTSRFDRNGIVYHAVCANCSGVAGPQSVDPRSFPTTPGVWSPTNNSTNCNLAAFKMSFNLTGISANFVPLDSNNVPLVGGQTRGCPPLQVNFDNKSTGGASATYQWDLGVGGVKSSAFEPTHVYTQPGTYIVQLVVTDSSTCNITDTTYQTIVVFSPASVDAGPNQEICPGDSVALLGSGSGSFLWTPGATLLGDTLASPQAFPMVSTQYHVQMTDSNGCIVRDSMVVTVDSLNWLHVLNDTSVCEGDGIQLSTTAPAGSQFAWSPAGTLNSPIVASPTAFPDSTTTYYLTAINPIGCEDTDSVTITIYHADAWGDTIVCPGSPASLFATGGVGYQWTPSGGATSPNSASTTVTTQATTTYNVAVTHVNGCVSNEQVTVRVFQLTPPNAGSPDTLCPGGTAQLISSGGNSYTWTPGNSLDDPTRRDPVASPTITTTYTVTITDNNGCTNSEDVTITVHPWPPVSAGADQTVCEGESLQLLATGAVSYDWRPDPTLSSLSVSNPVATPRDFETAYVVTGTDQIGCTATDTVWVFVTERPVTLVTDSFDPCDPEGTYQLFAAGGDRVIWSNGHTDRDLLFSPDVPTTLMATAYNGNCAGNPDSILLIPFDNIPQASFTADTLSGFVPTPVQFLNTSIGAHSYEWDFGTNFPVVKEENPDYIYAHAGTYTATLIAYSIQGCPDTATLSLSFENIALYVPNAFSPNGDAYNDAFYVRYYGMESIHVQIFDRWGILVFEAFQKDFEWDGTYKGSPVPEGVYVYVIRGQGENGLSHEKVGTVTVIR